MSLTLDRDLQLPIGTKRNVKIPLALFNGPLEYLDLLILAGLFGLSAARTMSSGRTPGNALLGPRVAGDCRRRGFLREIVRLLPLVPFAVPETLAARFPAEFGADSTSLQSVAVVMQLLGLALILLLWIVPLVCWRGALGHDRAAGLLVVRLSDRPM